jgi:predicted DCC family thiol-disulfide oxidoreductase YuxK
MASPLPATAIYDDRCVFCTVGSQRLARLARPGAIQLLGSGDPTRKLRFPQITDRHIDEALQLVTPDGRVHSGAAAIAYALGTRPLFRIFTWLYHVPGIHQLTNLLYALVARNRYRILGRTKGCESGVCAAKFQPPTSPPTAA